MKQSGVAIGAAVLVLLFVGGMVYMLSSQGKMPGERASENQSASAAQGGNALPPEAGLPPVPPEIRGCVVERLGEDFEEQVAREERALSEVQFAMSRCMEEHLEEQFPNGPPGAAE